MAYIFNYRQKVILKKNIAQREFDTYGNRKEYVQVIKSKKFVTVRNINLDEGHLTLLEIPQYWKLCWFIPYVSANQLEFDFIKNE